MAMSNWDPVAQREKNDNHRRKPLAGDVWEDHLVMVCIVLEVTEEKVTFCTHKKDVNHTHWTWDLDKIQVSSRAEFSRRFLYDPLPGYFGPKNCWANVMPEAAKKSFIPSWEAFKLKSTSKTPIRDNYR